MVSFKVNSTPRTATKTISFKSTTPSKSSSGFSALASTRNNSSSTKSSSSSSVSRPAVTPVPTKTTTFKTDTVTKVTPVATPASSGPSADFVAAASLFKPNQPAAEVTKTISFKTEKPASTPTLTNVTKKEPTGPSADFVAAAASFNPKKEAEPVEKTISFKTTTPEAPATSAELAAAVASFNPDKPAAPIEKTISFKTVGDVTNNIPTSNNSLLNTPALEAPKLSDDIQTTVESLMAAANKATANVAKRLDNAWDFGITQAQKTNAEDKIQTAYQKSLTSSKPVDSFNAILQQQLS